ncbi:hypothetical protein EYC59_02705 [Candidatus Saccharibacteria bacterium]|nr:MAG: hypothetical protein EYC59_02705 [Candidatus Saccharibacteria bacterium]
MKRLLSYISAALVVLFSVMAAVPASAQTSSGSSGLSINPRKNYVIEPGKTITDKLTIGNLDQKADLSVTLRMIDFSFTDQTGTPKLYLGQNLEQTTWSLKPFTKLPGTIVVPKGQSRTVEYTISIPANQGAGSYYSAIQYQTGTPNGDNVNLSASGVTLAFVSVPGVVNEDMNLVKFGAWESPNDGATGSYRFISTNSAPKYLAFTLKNNGNVAESPAGTIVLKNIFGKQVKTIENINPNNSLALIGQTRLFTSCIKSAKENVDFQGSSTTKNTCVKSELKPGRYTAELNAYYGQNGNKTKEITAVATFWYLPWWLIIVIVVALAALIGFVWWLVRKIRGASKKRRTGRR